MHVNAHPAKSDVRTARQLSDRRRLLLLGLIAAVAVAAFLVIGASGMWEYVLPRRTARVIAMIFAGTAIATSTVVFQTLSNNRILSPSIMGVDSLYVLVQTILLFVFGTTHPVVLSPNLNFLCSVSLMLVFSTVMYRLFFAHGRSNLFVMLLIGIVFGTFFQSAASFLQILVDPNEFLVLQDRMFASFNNVKTNLIAIAGSAIIVTALASLPYLRYLDVLALGEEHAVNLGVEQRLVVRRMLFVVFAMVSVSTALVGPITFLGLIVANLAYELLHTFRRLPLMLAASLIAIIALVGGQLLVERVFAFSTPISVIINLIGGLYFLYLIVKERTA